MAGRSPDLVSKSGFIPISNKYKLDINACHPGLPAAGAMVDPAPRTISSVSEFGRWRVSGGGPTRQEGTARDLGL